MVQPSRKVSVLPDQSLEPARASHLFDAEWRLRAAANLERRITNPDDIQRIDVMLQHLERLQSRVQTRKRR